MKTHDDYHEGQILQWVHSKEDSVKRVIRKVLHEIMETREGGRILSELIRGHKVTSKEKEILHRQTIDIIKGMGISAVFLAPGGAVLVAILVKLAKKYQINPLPSAFAQKELKGTIAVFGGTFDPVHLGHIGIAKELIENGVVDEIIFLPAATPPHKMNKQIVSPKDRLKMLTLAVEELNSGAYTVSTYELDRRDVSTSYSWQTMKELAKRNSHKSLYFLMGMDSLNTLHLWNNYLAFIDKNNFIIYTRPDSISPTVEELADRLSSENLKVGYDLNKLSTKLINSIVHLTDYPISSTAVRAAVASGRPLDKLVSPSVKHYILSNSLYTEKSND